MRSVAGHMRDTSLGWPPALGVAIVVICHQNLAELGDWRPLIGCMHEGASRVRKGFSYLRMFTARPATMTTVVIEARAWISIRSLARDVSGIVSVGLKAVAFVNDTYR